MPLKAWSMKYDYRQILKSEFDRRSSINSSYSLRAFARDLQIPAPQLSAIFLGKKGLSKKKAASIAKVLHFSKAEEKRFLAAVGAKHARSKVERETALRSLSHLDEVEGIATIETARFEVVADWHHLAILQLSETEGFSWNVREIAKKLGLSKEKVDRAIDALVSTGLLKQAGESYEKSSDFIRTEDIPSRAIRMNHQQMIAKAQEALEQQSIHERDFSSVTVAIDRNRLPEIKTWLREFRERFCLDAGQGDVRHDVYAMNIQFFRLNKPLKEKKI